VTVSTTIQANGVKEALSTIQSLNKSYRRAITREYAEIVAPMVADAKALVPKEVPMSGWERSWAPRGTRKNGEGANVLPWTGYSPKIGKFIRNRRNRPLVFGIRWADPSGVLFDTTGDYATPQGARMLAVLNERYGRPSRVMWRAYEQADTQIESGIRSLLDKIVRQANEELIKRNKINAYIANQSFNQGKT